jgi:hypothetical protein
MDAMRPVTTTLDACFVAALLGVAAVLLIPLRGSPLLENPYLAFGLVLGLPILLVATWCAVVRQPFAVSLPTGLPSVALALAALTFFAFYLPLRIHFWGGGDEHIALSDIDPLPSLLACDVTLNRPFTMLPAMVGQLLAPDRIDGFLWLGAGLVWANAFLLHRIVRELAPRMPLLSVAAAALFVVDRSDPARFFVLWASDYYWTAVGLTLLAIWLFLHSQTVGSRGLLSLACGILAIALLTNEGGYPLAGLTLVVGALRGERPRRWIWSIAWGGVLALVSARFVLFLRQHGAESYQATNVAGAIRSPEMLLENFALHASTIVSCFDCHGALRRHWPWALGAFAATIVALGERRGDFFAPSPPGFAGGEGRGEGGTVSLAKSSVFRGFAEPPSPPAPLPPQSRGERGVSSLRVALFAAVAMLAGMVPFLHMTHSFRAEFFAGPGKAVLVAALLGALVAPLRRFGGVALMLVVAAVAANATAEATARQLAARANSPVSFETTTHVFRQLHALGRFEPETVILVYLDDPDRSPLGVSYGAFMLGKEILGTKILVANDHASTPLPMTPLYDADGVSLPEGPSKRLWPGSVRYDQIVAVAVDKDGAVRLLDRLPSDALPVENRADRYDPARRLRTGPIGELSYLRYPTWARRLYDVFDPRDGILFGDGWGDLESGRAFRRVDVEANLVVNPLGCDRREIRLDVEAEDAERLEAVDADGQIVATAALSGRTEVRLEVPTLPDRLGRLRLRVVGASTAFRVCVPQRESKSAAK